MNKEKFIITKAHPQGFCDGVVRAIKLTKDALLSKDTKRPIYILGSTVHNKEISKAFASLGLLKISHEDLKKIMEGTVIISAHGVAPSVYETLKKNNVDIIDTTCKKVVALHDLIKEKIDLGYTVIFMGKANHEETIGALGISDKVLLFNENTDYSKIDKAILVCQTTLCFSDVANKFSELKQKYPSLELSCEICDATRVRQSAALNASKTSDLVLVVGDKESNNANTLVKSIKNTNKECYLIEGVSDLKDINLNNIKNITITSAASTPRVIVNEVIDTLNNIDTADFKTKIELLDYIK